MVFKQSHCISRGLLNQSGNISILGQSIYMRSFQVIWLNEDFSSNWGTFGSQTIGTHMGFKQLGHIWVFKQSELIWISSNRSSFGFQAIRTHVGFKQLGHMWVSSNWGTCGFQATYLHNDFKLS